MSQNFPPPDQEPTDPAPPGAEEDVSTEARLAAFGMGLAKKRDEWVRMRRSQGIDKRWTDDLDQYHAKDNANRMASSMMESVEQGFPVLQAHARPTRSTIFIGLTRAKANAAEARLADILLPTDDRNWGIQPTPLPHLVHGLLNEKQAVHPQNGPMVDQQGNPIQVKQIAAQVHQLAAAAAEAMQTEIEEQLNISDFNGEERKMLHDTVVLGTGVLKGPIVTNRVRKAWRQGEDATGKPFYEMQFMQELSPASFRVDPRNIIPDPSCGDNHRDGEGLFERDVMTGKRVRALGKQPGYNKDQLRKVLREGPKRSATFEMPQEGPEKDREVSQLNKTFEVWEYWGEIDREDAIAAGVQLDDEDDELESVSVCVIMINETVVKAFLNPLDDGDIPYDFYQWEKVTGSVWGYGVAYIMRAQQKVINTSWRQLMDNLGVTAGPQIVVKRRQITPADQVWDIHSRKIWYASDEVADVRQAFTAVEFNSHSDELLKVIEFAMKLVDEETAVPMLDQGEKGTAPDTVGGMQMLMNASNVVLRRLVKQFDDDVTRPHIRRYYDYNMLYSPKNEIKGDFSIDARGSSALLVRDIQNQAFMSLMQAGANPTYGIFLDLQKLFEKALQAQHIDPAEIMASDAEIQRRQQAASQQPPNPAVQVAQIKVQGEQQRTQSNEQIKQLEAQTAMQQMQIDRATKLEELQAQKEILMLTLASKQNISLQQIKADLAKTVINTNTQKELKASEHHLAAQAQLAEPTPDPSTPGPYDQGDTAAGE